MNDMKALWEDMKDAPLTTMLIILALIGFANYIILNFLQFSMSPQKLDIYADIFSKLSFGFGAMSAGLGGFRYLSHYFEYEKKTIRIKIP